MAKKLTLRNLLLYRNRRVHVVGVAGTEGFAVLEFLLKHEFRNLTAHNISGGDALRRSFLDTHIALPPAVRSEALQRLVNAPVRLCTGMEYLNGIESADLIFASQNWFAYTANDPLKTTRQRGIPMCFVTQLYFALSPAPIIAVTGTNGKTTVTTCLSHVFRSAGIPCLSSGNDRYQAQVIDRLDTLPANGFLVLEISNRQLLELEQNPQIAVLTNIRPDHIDEHGSFDAYRNTKASLFTRIPSGGWSVLNAEDPYSPVLSKSLRSHCVFYGLNPPATPISAGYADSHFSYRDADGTLHPLFDVSDVRLPGRHNLLNCLAAAATAFIAGVPSDAIRTGIQTFRGVRHRIEFLEEVNGVAYYDDEASTNPQATRTALETLNRPVVLIVGGETKGNTNDYAVFRDIPSGVLKHIIRLPGDAGRQVADHADRVPVHPAGDLNEAMFLADRLLCPGDALLLSPAGAGFHSRFNAGPRGFRRLVRDRRRQASRAGKSAERKQDR